MATTTAEETTAVADVRLDRLTKRFDDVVAVDGVSVEIPRGSFFALLGPSGCGKTTTLRMVAGLEIPTEGQVRLGDQDITGLKPYKRPVNTVFQNYALFPHLTIHENVAFGLRRRGHKDVDKPVQEMLELVELGQRRIDEHPGDGAARHVRARRQRGGRRCGRAAPR